MIGAALLATALALPAAPAQAAQQVQDQLDDRRRAGRRAARRPPSSSRSAATSTAASTAAGRSSACSTRAAASSWAAATTSRPRSPAATSPTPRYGSAIGDEFDRVVVWDLKVGKVRFEVGSNTVSALAVKSNGSVAWIQRSVVQPANRDLPVYEVHALSAADREGDLLLDRAADISPRTLGLSANREAVIWARGGAQRSSPLR